MNFRSSLPSWLRPPESDYRDLKRIATRMVDQYTRDVDADASPHILSESLTGFAGCLLAMAGVASTGSQSHRIGGLLALELAFCARENADHRGIRAVEFLSPVIGPAIIDVAFAYGRRASYSYGGHVPPPPVPVGRSLRDLRDAAAAEFGSLAVNIAMVPLIDAHRRENI